jgi:hypothetical protein
MSIRLSKPGGAEIISLAGVVLFGLFLALDHAKMPEAERTAVALENELMAITPPSGARMLDGISRMVKTTGVVVSKRYTIAGAESEVSDHFRRQLTNHGWSPCAPEGPTFCKGDFRGSVEVEKGTPTLDVAVVMSWR